MTQSTLIPYEEQRRSFLSCCYRFHEVLPGLLAMFFIAIFSNNLAGVPNPFTLQNLFHYLDNVIGPVNGQPLFQILNSNFVWNPFLVGFIIVNVFGIPDSWKRGLSYIHKLMPLGIIMLAPHFVFSHATKAGWPIIIIALVVMFVMASVTMWLGRLFKVDDRQAGDITGALVTGDPHVTAILMPMLKAKNGQVINALACVLLFGLIMSFLLPVVGNLLGMEEPVFGLLSVLGIGNTGQMYNAAFGYGYEAGRHSLVRAHLRGAVDRRPVPRVQGTRPPGHLRHGTVGLLAGCGGPGAVLPHPQRQGMGSARFRSHLRGGHSAPCRADGRGVAGRSLQPGDLHVLRSRHGTSSRYDG